MFKRLNLTISWMILVALLVTSFNTAPSQGQVSAAASGTAPVTAPAKPSTLASQQPKAEIPPPLSQYRPKHNLTPTRICLLFPSSCSLALSMLAWVGSRSLLSRY